MDTCKYCDKECSIEEFVKNAKSKLGYLRKCLDCRKAYRQMYKTKPGRARTYSEIKADMVRQAKSVPCYDCKTSYPYYVMDLDHLPEFEKKFSPSRCREYSIEEVRQELLKCEPVCANCHRIRTHARL